VKDVRPSNVGAGVARDREPVVYRYREPSAFARLLASLSSVTGVEPDALFADEAVLVEGELLIRLFQARVTAAAADPAHHDRGYGDQSRRAGGVGRPQGVRGT
jgi:hypothetical protein